MGALRSYRATRNGDSPYGPTATVDISFEIAVA
jgi:hypothetical protein